MATAAQIAANIANSKKSCGPKTPEGKARARDNALKHGLFAATLLIKGEDPEQYSALVDDLIEEFQPVGTVENLLLSLMSAYHWQSRRATINLSKQFESSGEQDNAKQISLALRCQTTADRGFYLALNELRKAQNERYMTAETEVASESTEEEIGFVPQSPEAQEPEAPEPEDREANDAPESAPPENQARPAQIILSWVDSTSEQDRIRVERYLARKNKSREDSQLSEEAA